MQLKSKTVIIRKVENGYTVKSVINAEDVVYIARNLIDAMAFISKHYTEK